MQIILEKRRFRLLPVFAAGMAIVALIALAITLMSVSAGHTGGEIELDTRVGGCPDPSGPDPAPPTCGDANTVDNNVSGDNDWVDVCGTFTSEGVSPPTGFFSADITEKASLPADINIATCDRDYFKSDQTYFDSEKDIIDICGDDDNPCAGNSLGVGGVPAQDSWECVELSNPLSKNEILNSYAVLAVPDGGASAGDQVLYYGFEREGNEGTAFMGFWFVQNDASCVHSGTGRTSFSGGPHAVRCGILTPDASCPGGVENVGDILVLVNYTGGGRIAEVRVGAWDPGLDDCANVADSSDPICQIAAGSDCSVVIADDDACAVVNTRQLDKNGTTTATTWPLAPWNNGCVPAGPIKCNSGTRNTLDVNQFFEGNLNLTNIFGANVPCFSSFISETRSSAEFTATLKDFSRGDFDTCGKATIIKQTDPDGATGTFSYTSELPCGDFSLVDADATPAQGEDGVHVCESLEPSTYLVTEDDPTTLDPPFDLVNIVCTVDVDGGTSYRIGFIDGGGNFDPGATDEYDSGDDTVELNIGLLGEITCTYTNRQRGSILVRKEDEDGELLPGACFTFDPDPADGTSAAVEVCDGDTADQADDDDGLVCIDNVVFGDYDITESQAPPGYEPDPDTETVTVDSTSTCAARLADTAVPDATFVNKLGTILIHKVSTKTDTFVDGACFTIDDDALNELPFSGTVCDDDFAAADFSDTDAADGVICVEDVPLGSYDITESTVPDGYAGDPDTETVIVDDSDSCADKAGDGGADATFENVPLSDIQIRFRDAGSGETSLDSAIVCDNGTGTSDTTDTSFWDDTLTISDIEIDPSPQTITCTIVIDP